MVLNTLPMNPNVNGSLGKKARATKNLKTLYMEKEEL